MKTSLSKTQKLVDGLKLLGYIEVDSRSRKYRVFVRGDDEPRYLVGKSGALRKTPGSIDQSVSITDSRAYKAILQIGSGPFCRCTVEQAKEVYRGILGLDKSAT